MDQLVRGTDPRIRIRTKMSQIPNTDLGNEKVKDAMKVSCAKVRVVGRMSSR
jgi:hypothetical protein